MNAQQWFTKKKRRYDNFHDWPPFSLVHPFQGSKWQHYWLPEKFGMSNNEQKSLSILLWLTSNGYKIVNSRLPEESRMNFYRHKQKNSIKFTQFSLYFPELSKAEWPSPLNTERSLEINLQYNSVSIDGWVGKDFACTSVYTSDIPSPPKSHSHPTL